MDVLQDVPTSLLHTLSQPSPSTCRGERIDFKALGFSEHENAFAILIHDLLTPEECDEIRTAAELVAHGQWDAALINAGGRMVVASHVRLCDRIMWDNAKIADALLARIRPHIPSDIATLKDSPHITSDDPVWSDGTWRIVRLNERLRFLRYQPGMYFRQHSDGFYVTPDESEVSFLTVHLYLRGSSDLRGGATRFFGEDEPGHINTYDVDPSPGACLVFQHHDLVHSGEDVLQGTKYTMRTDVMYRRDG
ncbi:hypothetical protein AC578_5065 [Pseudocercospora eumusae]|uniref:Fe2OG dioxygenase domain-containing protein n=1 Tax=Pseudocercospora eumusae TaxID=321146 RepID=A0A139HIF6_9PEZI|nr:hypothetical protein AC578_5065 [Pseudocercospora eumusae]